MTDTQSPPFASDVVVLSRAEHSISRQQIDQETLKVLYRLQNNGFKAFLVGGGVRDLLLGRKPKDFDVGTDATPNQVRKLFRNCFLVGRRFRLAHIRFGRDMLVEVATFRRQATTDDLLEDSDDHHFASENIFGTPQEDAFRRDFTINALFYNIEDFSIVDYVGGLRDLAEQRIRVIGDPSERFAEDPVRMLRALEFAARLGFSLDPALIDGIHRSAPLIASAAPARLREELMELFRHKVATAVLRQAQEFGLLAHLLPGYVADATSFGLLEEVDRRTTTGTTVTEVDALAALYLSRFLAAITDAGPLDFAAAMHLANEALTDHCQHFHIAHGIRHQAREMLLGCHRLLLGRGRRGERRFLLHPSTARALELLAAYSRVTGDHADLVTIWENALQRAGAPPEAHADDAPKPGGKRRRRSRHRRGRKPAATPEPG
jgi:poly(A) polymerase